MDTNMDSVVVGGWVLTPDPGLRGVNAGRRFELAEELRRFAEAQAYRAMVILHDDAQRKTPAHLEALESGPGMGISARSGNL
ncbi:hypothetical protein, partial [Arthrobacter sp. KK5.5]|uniref:hypothetical protein n=1 Tax=Arthrobacter sp. KK5.5 TaxID=3373084 RepID=UPI003EE70EAE